MFPYYDRSKTFSQDNSFFKNLNSLSAYVFGFWMADGSIRHQRHYRISFYSRDISILSKIKTAIKSDRKIYKEKRKGVYTNNYALYLYSKQLFLDICKLGGSPKKSRVLTLPDIQDQFFPDFLRGYFDGDGSVHFISYKASKNGKIYTEIRSNFTCGSKLFLKQLEQTLYYKLHLARKTIGQYGPFQFKLGYGQKDTKKLMDFMYYPEHKISLERKRRYLDKFYLSKPLSLDF